MLLQQLLNGIVLGSIYTLIALGLTMIFGILDITLNDDFHGDCSYNRDYL